MGRYIGIFISLFWCSVVYSVDMKAEYPTILKAAKRNMCDGNDLLLLLAIRHAENGRKGLEFGVMHPKAFNTNLDIQAGWAAATIIKNRKRWNGKGDFIEFLGSRYAPIGADNDPTGLNKNWVSNVTYWYKYYQQYIGVYNMSWKDKMKEFGGGNFTFLSMDGETIVFIVVGEPVLLRSKYKGKEQDRIGCPVVTDEGFQLFICGKRLARKLSKVEAKFDKHAICVTRQGAEGDVNATYKVTVLDDTELFKRLYKIAKDDYEEGMIADAVKDAEKVLEN